PFAEANAEESGVGLGTKDYSLTTVLGLNKEFSYNKNLIDLKKEFCCNGTVVQDPELGLVIQIQNIESKLRQIEEDPEGAGTAHLYSVTLKISGVANRAFEPLFERQTQAEKIRSIQGMLQRFRTLFNLPSAIRGNIRKGEYDLAAIAQVRTVYSFVGESKALNSYSEAIQNTLKLGYKAGMAKGLGIGCTYGIACMSWALVFCLPHYNILQVRLCREKATSNVYAMKKVKKSEMLRRGQVLLCGFLGIPPSNGVLHQSPVHTKSLTVLKRQLLSKKMVDTAKESIGGSATSLEIYGKMEEVFIKMDSEENTDSVDRELKNFKDAVLQEGNEEGRLAREFDPRKHIEAHLPVQSILVGGCVGAMPVIRMIPTSVLLGYFAYMAIDSLPVNQFWERIQLLFITERRRYKHMTRRSSKATLSRVSAMHLLVHDLLEVVRMNVPHIGTGIGVEADKFHQH
ncbi:hypothetical protein ACJX0J_012988, partial [Zea mays]